MATGEVKASDNSKVENGRSDSPRMVEVKNGGELSSGNIDQKREYSTNSLYPGGE